MLLYAGPCSLMASGVSIGYGAKWCLEAPGSPQLLSILVLSMSKFIHNCCVADKCADIRGCVLVGLVLCTAFRCVQCASLASRLGLCYPGVTPVQSGLAHVLLVIFGNH